MSSILCFCRSINHEEYANDNNMSSFDEVKNLFQTLKTEWNKKKPDFKQCNNILLQMKVSNRRLFMISYDSNKCCSSTLILHTDLKSFYSFAICASRSINVPIKIIRVTFAPLLIYLYILLLYVLI